ncbi:MFS transporter [Anaerotignum sp.]|uniref:MFS transporter n=1 Tax=Anaerotignum sp. TaxID=2039241 RepID=UPI0028AC8179|nr:MFS transporter [Anaerotignum sp.]
MSKKDQLEIEAKALGYTTSEYKKFRTNAWKVLMGFSILYCFLYCGRLNMGLSIPAMVDEMGWTIAELGVLSAIFFWSYGMGHLFNGRLGEIFGVNRFIIAAVFLSAAVNVLISFQNSLVVIAILWGLNGYFQSMAWSPGVALITKWWPGKKRGFATGLANAFSGFGQVACWFSVAIAFSIAPKMGWRAAFIFPVIIVVIVAIAYGFLVKEKPSDIGLQEYAEEDKAKAKQEAELTEVLKERGKLYPYIHLLKMWRFDIWLLIIAGASIARYGLLTWIPTYYNDVFQVDVKAGILGTVLLPLGMGFGTLIVPWATDKFCPTNRLPAVILCAVVSGITVFFFPRLGPGVGASALLFTAGFFIYAINGVVWAFAADVGGRVFAGTATGILDCAAYLGASVQAIYFGSAIQSGNWNILFVVIGITCVLIAVLAVIAGLGLSKDKEKNKDKYQDKDNNQEQNQDITPKQDESIDVTV